MFDFFIIFFYMLCICMTIFWCCKTCMQMNRMPADDIPMEIEMVEVMAVPLTPRSARVCRHKITLKNEDEVF